MLPVGAENDLGRPERFNGALRCGYCEQDVEGTQKAHRVPREYLADHAVVDTGHDEIPVFGFYCRYCSRVLAIDPHSDTTDLGPGTGWIAVQADLATGDCGPVLVPTQELYK